MPKTRDTDQQSHTQGSANQINTGDLRRLGTLPQRRLPRGGGEARRKCDSGVVRGGHRDAA
ncbi:hypothetical protein E2C01_091972 [Portunus trituberculatus]|uniref:Uncharacterized protein n=1 Tax=Portunus trituberculatus TaxID=210409 RepID=A0A5B7JU98_PORTR|nr:hypothetical protein [Portunus trituberculatus]